MTRNAWTRSNPPPRRRCHNPSQSRRRPCARAVCRRRFGFTLIEILVGVLIISILLSISGVAIRQLADSSVLAQARNAVITYAQVARSYAVTNHIETMLVVNPYNGQFEIWYLNPPAQGGKWDPLSSGDPTDPAQLSMTDGTMFGPVLDASARLPLDGDGRPAALVSPIDYEERPHDSTDPAGDQMDNLVWAAFCFNENGHLVLRTRRIATRTFTLPNGWPNPNPNRLRDASPDLALLPLVSGNDAPITSTCGFVISDMSKLRAAVGEAGMSPSDLVNDWLMWTRQGERYADHSATVVLNRFSGEQLQGDS